MTETHNHDDTGDSVAQASVSAPIVPGFYKDTDGNQIMIYLLRDNREIHRFFRSEDIKYTDNDWQWYVIMNNGEMAKCEWGYIEQTLVNGNKLVKIS